MSKNIRVYKMDDFSWIATPYNLKETIKWWEEEFGEEVENIHDIIECPLTDTMWMEISDNKPLTEIAIGQEYKIGDVKLIYGSRIKKVTYEMFIEMQGDIQEPFVIASTEY